MTTPDRFIDALNDRFSGVLSWQELQELWDAVLREANAGWYIYAIGEPLPHSPCSAADIERFLAAIDNLLEHDLREESCNGIVCADSRENPLLLKIYDLFHMGSACRRGAAAPLSGWILTRVPPTELKTDRVLPENRRRWWRELWQQAPAAQYVLNG